MALKKGDFVEIEYTGKIKDSNIVFDTTDEKIAKENNIFNQSMTYGPTIVCIGEKQLLSALDDSVEGKEIGQQFTIELKPEQAFGKKNAKLLRMIPSNIFRKQNIMPQPGLQVNIDGIMGTVITVTGGRVIVDFNHPLSGRDLIYDLKLNKIVTDKKDQVESILNNKYGIKDAEIKIENDELTIKFKKETKKEVKDKIKEDLVRLVPFKKLDL